MDGWMDGWMHVIGYSVRLSKSVMCLNEWIYRQFLDDLIGASF